VFKFRIKLESIIWGGVLACLLSQYYYVSFLAMAKARGLCQFSEGSMVLLWVPSCTLVGFKGEGGGFTLGLVLLLRINL